MNVWRSLPIVLTCLALSLSLTLTATADELTPIPEQPRDIDLLPVFLDLIQPTDMCQLPCIWGITPGETSLAQTSEFLEQHDFDRSWEEFSDRITLEEYTRIGEPFSLKFIDSYPEYDFPPFVIDFKVQDDLVERMNLSFRMFNDWLPFEFNRFTPARVFHEVNAIPDVYIDKHPTPTHDLVLRYANLGVSIHYSMTRTFSQRLNQSQFCLSAEYITGFSLTLANVTEPLTPLNPDVWISVEQAFDIDPMTFTEFVVENPNGCMNDSNADERPANE